MQNDFSSQYQEDIALKIGNNKLNFIPMEIPSSSNKYAKGCKNKKKNKLEEVSSQDKSFNIYNLGEIKYSEYHQKANIPLRQLKDPDSSIIYCPCCMLPCEKKDI